MAIFGISDLAKIQTRHCSIEVGREIEDAVFDERGYGVMSKKWDDASNFIGAYSRDDELLGVTRLILSAENAFPALNEVPLHSAPVHRCGMAMEYASIAVCAGHQSHYGHGLAMSLYAAGFVFSILARCEHLYSIMEPRRVAAMNRRDGMNWVPIGPVKLYMGGEVCAHYASTKELLGSLLARNEPFGRYILNQIRRISGDKYEEYNRLLSL